MNWFKKKGHSPPTLYDNLEKSMGKFPGTDEVLRISHLLSGLLITGGARTGKTSAVLKWVAILWFKMGFGGLFTTTRIGDAQTIRTWAKLAGREDEDIVVFDNKSSFSLSMFDYEASRTDEGANDTAHMADNMLLLHELISGFEAGGGNSQNEEAFWKGASKSLIINSIDLLKLSETKITWKSIRMLAQNALCEIEVKHYSSLSTTVMDERLDDEVLDKAWEELNEWHSSNFFLNCFNKANNREDLTERQKERFTELSDYWFQQHAFLSEKTKSIVDEILYSICRPFETSEILKNHFSEGVSFDVHPDRTIFDNKIIILDFGPKSYGVNGICATAITKLIFQQAWERRNLEAEGSNANPVMCMIDEFQYYVCKAGNTDTLFTSTAGGSLVAQVYVTQNIENLIMAMGGRNHEAHAKSILGNLNLKLLCSNSDYATNKWASDTIGFHFTDTQSTTINPDGVKRTFNQHWAPKVPPSHFTTLSTGRKEFEFKVSTIVFQTGRIWPNGENFYEITYSQTKEY